jgi:DNA-directed RNA polymerase specialized sigma24 family protein
MEENLNLPNVERVLRSHLHKLKHLDRWEDGIQEGLIRAWKDMEEGMDAYWQVINRAKMWAKTYILNSDGRRHATGHLPTTRAYGNTFVKPLVTEDNHIDHKSYVYTSFDAGTMEEMSQASFEDVLLSELTFEEMVKDLEPKHRKAVTLNIRFGYSVKETGQALGYDAHPQPNAYKVLKKAFAQVKENAAGE